MTNFKCAVAVQKASFITKNVLALLLLLFLCMPGGVQSMLEETTEENDDLVAKSKARFLYSGCDIAAVPPYCPLPKDCTDIQNLGYSKSGVYTVHIGPYNKPVDVYCDQGWLVFQRRHDGFTDFHRGWDEYANGFGDLHGEFWLGNHFISLITQQNNYRLRVDLETFEGETEHADYTTFKVGGPHLKYALTVGGYSSGRRGSLPGDSLEHHNGHKFSTHDQDNDADGSNCARKFTGAWWFGSCHRSNLNGKYLAGGHSSYADGVNWEGWMGYYYSMKTTTMKIAPL